MFIKKVSISLFRLLKNPAHRLRRSPLPVNGEGQDV